MTRDRDCPPDTGPGTGPLLAGCTQGLDDARRDCGQARDRDCHAPITRDWSVMSAIGTTARHEAPEPGTGRRHSVRTRDWPTKGERERQRERERDRETVSYFTWWNVCLLALHTCTHMLRIGWSFVCAPTSVAPVFVYHIRSVGASSDGPKADNPMCADPARGEAEVYSAAREAPLLAHRVVSSGHGG